MNARTRRSSGIRRTVATICITMSLAAVAPATASADEFWGLWYREVKQRIWWERPFAIIFSTPAMIVTTPFWAGTKAYGKLTGDD
jgi:hypothetical protein